MLALQLNVFVCCFVLVEIGNCQYLLPDNGNCFLLGCTAPMRLISALPATDSMMTNLFDGVWVI